MELPSDASNIPLVARGQLCGLNEVNVLECQVQVRILVVLSDVIALFLLILKHRSGIERTVYQTPSS
jgi:hypothetical protein